MDPHDVESVKEMQEIVSGVTAGMNKIRNDSQQNSRASSFASCSDRNRHHLLGYVLGAV